MIISVGFNWYCHHSKESEISLILMLISSLMSLKLAENFRFCHQNFKSSHRIIFSKYTLMMHHFIKTGLKLNAHQSCMKLQLMFSGPSTSIIILMLLEYKCNLLNRKRLKPILGFKLFNSICFHLRILNWWIGILVPLH